MLFYMLYLWTIAAYVTCAQGKVEFARMSSCRFCLIMSWVKEKAKFNSNQGLSTYFLCSVNSCFYFILNA